uniref:Peptidase M13 C-terminal domain-containing protein n=1 Tax=Strigamia maritima TaxID=126957 RepID=T1IL62_STRMM
MTNNAVEPAVPTSFEESTQKTPRPKAAKIRKKKSTKVLKAILATALLIILILTIILLTQSFKSTECQNETTVCTTQECTMSAATLMASMHRNEDPCEDFFSFVCGKDDNVTPDVFITLLLQLQKKLKQLLMKPTLPDEAASISNAKNFYIACMDTDKIKKLGLKPLNDILQNLAPGWPWLPEELKSDYANVNTNNGEFISDENPSNESMKNDDFGVEEDLKVEEITNDKLSMTLEQLLGKLSRHGMLTNKIINIEVIEDFDDRRIMRLTAVQSEPKEGIKRQKKKKAVENDELFKTQLSKTIYLLTEKENSAEIKREIVRMLALKKQLEPMNASGKYRTNFTLRNNKMSIADLTKLTQNFSMESTIANFAVWNALIEPVLEHVFAPDISNFIEVDRFHFCISTITEHFPFGNKFIQLIRESYKNLISNSKWLDRTTKRNAMEKLDKMSQLVGFPTWIKNDTKLDEYYKDVNDRKRQSYFKFLFCPRNRRWSDEFGVVNTNAFYAPRMNSIGNALNFGGVGSIIGHEIGHAFDNKYKLIIVGSQFDGNGSLWSLWSDNSKKIYDDKTQCYVDQYNNYCFQGVTGSSNNTCVDGLFTVGENIPDNTGLHAAFNAYKAWIKMQKIEKQLPGLAEFTPEQIFFISYGYIWCEDTTVESWISSGDNKEDSHSPVRYRVQGPLSNFEEFAKAFNCNKGPMNRMDERCTLW